MSDATLEAPLHADRRHQERRRRLFRATMVGVTLVYLTVLLLAPLAGILWVAFRHGFSDIFNTLSLPDVQHAFLLTAIIAVITVIVTTFFGIIVAWVLARQRFRGHSLFNALVDLPLAVSPVTVGLMAVLLFGRGGWFEPFFAARGIQIMFALPSMIIVTIFICIPFVIREVAPVLEEIGTSEEDAARTLGASSTTSFRRVTLPNIRWGLFYGIALTTARSIGEIGAVLIVSGMIQGQTETATLYIFRALEERQTESAYVVALSLAAVSVILLGTIEWFKRRASREVD
jgi:sulfate transport system permease protein